MFPTLICHGVGDLRKSNNCSYGRDSNVMTLLIGKRNFSGWQYTFILLYFIYAWMNLNKIYIVVFLVFYSFCKYKNVYISRFCSLPRRRRKSRLLYSSVYNRCDGNGKFSYMRDRGVKETMSQWIFISLIATNERVVYSRF